jgi:biopolymer transport protein ExbB/TolQ
MWGELAFSLQSGNYYIIAIISLAFIGNVIAFERFIMLQFVYNIEFLKFLNNLKKMIASEDLERAINFCKSVSQTSLPKIALKALQASESDPFTVRGTIEEETIEFIPRVERRLGGLPAIATLILLIGILGSIDQLWWAFHSIDVLDTAKKQASLANGIATALNPTALGLMVCMIILASHQMLKGMAISVLEHIHHGIAVLHNLLVPSDVAYVSQPAVVQPETGTNYGSDLFANNDKKSSSQKNEEGSAIDDFDDSTVEDIKDEEEII